MKLLLLGVLALGCISAFGNVECYINNKAGEHIDFNEKSSSIDTGAPFGVVRLEKAKRSYLLSSIVNGEETIISFKKQLSLTKQNALGVSNDSSAGVGNIVCE